MKIGILTLPLADNYGGILQAVALYRYLCKEGHEVTLIYKDNYEVLWKKIVINILLKIPFHNFKNIKSNQLILDKWKARKDFHRPFVEKEIFTISKNLYTKKDLEKFSLKEGFDAVIVGSDQVWRKAYINDIYYKSYFLDFLDGKKTKKIAYAASFGKNHWEGEGDESIICKLLNDFTAVSTREVSGIDICKKSFDFNNVSNVLDPTAIIGKEFYLDKIIAKYDVSNISKNCLLTYVLDEAKEKQEIIEYFKKELTTSNLNHLKGFNKSESIFTVPEWLASIYYCDFLVTDSFHGMIFSIIFEKEFIVIGNKERGLDRFSSLLSLLDLEERLIFNVKDLKNKDIDRIDYKKVNKVLNDYKNKSLNYLNCSLSGINK